MFVLYGSHLWRALVFPRERHRRRVQEPPPWCTRRATQIAASIRRDRMVRVSRFRGNFTGNRASGN